MDNRLFAARRPQNLVGSGIHACGGAAIARLEAEILLPVPARRVRTIELARAAQALPQQHAARAASLPLRAAAA